MIGLVERHGIEQFRALPDKALMAFATGNQFKPPASRALTLNNALRRSAGRGDMRMPSPATWRLAMAGRAAKPITSCMSCLRCCRRSRPILPRWNRASAIRPMFKIYGRSFSEMFLLKFCFEIALVRRHTGFRQNPLGGGSRRLLWPGGRNPAQALSSDPLHARRYRAGGGLRAILSVECVSRQRVGLPGKDRRADPHSLRAPNCKFQNISTCSSMSRRFRKSSAEQVAMYAEFAHACRQRLPQQ